jgi:SAM-dependent methyltransferase
MAGRSDDNDPHPRDAPVRAEPADASRVSGRHCRVSGRPVRLADERKPQALLVAIEAEREAAARLRESYASTNVVTVLGDATAMAFDDGSFDSAGCFTMLHHVPSSAAQNRLLGEVLRVLRPGGALIGSDGLPSDDRHRFHEADTYNPVEPGTLITRLQTIGFDRITVNVDGTLRFIAHKPADDPGSLTHGR